MTLIDGPSAAQSHGEVFTRRWVVEVLLDLTGYTADRNLGELTLVEPSAGSGAFLLPALERLLDSADRHGRLPETLAGAVRAWELQPDHVARLRQAVVTTLTTRGVGTATATRLARTWIVPGDFLLSSSRVTADVVVGNPPYIRYDDLPEDIAFAYRQTWQTMRGRGDIYVGFIERSLQMLTPSGRLGFICADRWMRNQYGSELRALVADRYAVEHVWTMHDVDAFESPVSAYPAITVLANRPQASAIVADTTADFTASSAFSLAKAVQDSEVTDFTDIGVTAHRLPHWFNGDELWPTGSPTRLALIELLNDRFGPLHDPRTGTKVSIGVATGADGVYVTKDPNVAEPDRILPLSMRHDLISGTFEWQGNYLVNPWADDGSLVALDDYPRLASYLSQHPKLRERHVAKRAPSSWHRTIDKVHADLTAKPKLLLQDMKVRIHPVLEPGGCYPHHNLYYVVSDTWDLEVLGGILLSRIAQAFIEAYCVRMRGGTLRFQAQYLKRIRVPMPSRIDDATQSDLRTAFRNRDADAATRAAGIAYGIDPHDYGL